MAKFTPSPLSSLTNEASAVSLINTNLTNLATALENTLSRDGTTPNTMSANLDINNYRLINLPSPIGSTEPMRKQDVEDLVASTLGVEQEYIFQNVIYYGADSTGVLDSAAAITSAMASTKTLVFKAPGTYLVNTTVSIPASYTVIVEAGAKITSSNGSYFTCLGKFISLSPSQIFDGSLVVRGIRDVEARWWGASISAADNSAALAAATYCSKYASTVASYVTDYAIRLPGEFITVKSQWTIAITNSWSPKILGTGTALQTSRIVAASDFVGDKVIKIEGTLPSETLTDIYFEDITVSRTAGSSAKHALYWEDINGFHEAAGCYNCHFVDFQKPLYHKNSRLITYTLCSSWTEDSAEATQRAIVFESTAGNFCGDITLDRCQFIVERAAGHYAIELASSGTSAQTRRIYIQKCNIYDGAGQILAQATSGGNIGDIVVEGTTFNGPLNTNGVAIYLSADGTDSAIEQVRVYGCIFTYTAANKTLVTVTSSSGVCRDIVFTANEIAWFTGEAISLSSATYGYTIVSNTFRNGDNPAGAIITTAGSKGVICDNVYWTLAPDTSSAAYFVSLSSGADWNIITPNSVSAVTVSGYQDSSGASNNVVSRNILTNVTATTLTTSSYVKTTATVVGSLPSAATVGAGSRSFVTDANATTFASIVAGGGSNGVPVYSDGTNWRIG